MSDFLPDLRDIHLRLARIEDALGGTQVYVSPAERGVADVLHHAAFKMKLCAGDIAGPRRHASLFRARCAVCWTVDQLGFASLTPTGKVLGDRDHTTIMNAIARGNDMRLRDPDFRLLTDQMVFHFQSRNG